MTWILDIQFGGTNIFFIEIVLIESILGHDVKKMQAKKKKKTNDSRN